MTTAILSPLRQGRCFVWGFPFYLVTLAIHSQKADNMKQFLLFIIVTALGTTLFAQGFTINPDPVVVSGLASTEFEGVGYAEITNGFPQAKNLRWQRTNIEITTGWETAICDKNQCYEAVVGNADFTLDPSERGRLDVHARPGGVEGAAVVEVRVVDLDDASNTAVALYYFNTSPSSTDEPLAVRAKVYPNPSDGLFTVKGDKQINEVQIFSLTGRMVRSFRYNDGQWYNITDLPKGTYLIRLMDRGGQQLTTKLMNKM